MSVPLNASFRPNLSFCRAPLLSPAANLDHRRPQYAIVKHVPTLKLRNHGIGTLRPLIDHDRLMQAGVERLANSLDWADTSRFENRPKLALDQQNALQPWILEFAFGERFYGSMEIIEHREDLGDDVFTGMPANLLHLLLCPAAVIDKLGTRALRFLQVFRGTSAFLFKFSDDWSTFVGCPPLRHVFSRPL
ncbi:hypothetical protein NITHO_3540003 [Nitrolancea hollandica Lb]|uniref:Uncharacterized protein n=1 Tax=Nitrolancea hollandica Lb TaxID=1129897 RepID=I4EIL6_9BACT|nr:hypothetical protein NITHO_3540003 [Nitrolancea hollandica Lb]